MSKVNDSSLWNNDNAADGDVVDQTAWNQNMQVFKAAINDNQNQINTITGSPTYTPNPNPNLLFNPTGALRSAGWVVSGTAVAWTPSFGLYGEGSYFKSGTVSNNASDAQYESSHIPAGANTQFTISGQIYTGGLSVGGADLRIDCWDSNNNALTISGGGDTNSVVNTASWQDVSKTITTPANTAYITVRLVILNGSTGYASFRRIKLEEGSIVTAFNDLSTLNTVEYAGQLRPACRAYANATQNYSSINTDTLVTFGAVDYDNSGSFSTSSSRFTAPSAGVYEVVSTVTMNSAVDGMGWLLSAHKNGSRHSFLSQGLSGAAGNLSANGVAQIQLSAGDYLEIYLSVTSTCSGAANNQGQFVAVAKVV